MPGTVSDVSATFVASTTRRPSCGRKTRCCSRVDSRAYSGRISTSAAQPALQRLGGVADLALAGEEDEHVAGPLAQQLLDRVADRVRLVALGLLERAVAHLDRVRAARDLDHRRVAEVAAEALRIDRRRGDDQLEVGAARQDPREVAEQEVDVEAALVRLVDDDRVVAAQQLVALGLGEQQAVGHEPHERVAAAAVAEADRVADGLAQRHLQLVRDALGDRARREPPRLRVRDRAVRPSSRQIFGSCVVLPEPVSPATTTTWLSRIAASRSSLRSETGSSGG